MIKLFKNHLFVLLFIGLVGCSSNTNVGQDDLSISEIEDIEKTGEFSEDDFFKDEEILKQSGVKLDIEGLDDTNLKSKDSNLASDIDILDFEGEGFDKDDDFETDLAGGGNASEFDEFDEFVTSDKVAKNEDIIKNKAPKIADIAEQPTMTEEDIFSEFEESTDVASSGSSSDSMLGSDVFGEIEETPVVADKTEQPNLDFEDIFNESDSSSNSDFSSQVADSTPNIDTKLDTEVDIQDYKQDIFEDVGTTVAENSNVDKDFGPGPSPKLENSIPAPKSDRLQAENMGETRTAKQILAQQSYNQPEQVVTNIVQKVQTWIPVKKMRTEPFRQNDILLNALYVVREGDSFKSIGEKIYGKGSINNLAQLNPFLSRNKLKVGEKVYYNSPNRPNDESQILFYFEDIGRPAQYREANAGENIRTIAQELLGHPRSWMEIWATNMDIVSKGILERPYKIKYFSKNNVQSMVQDIPEAAAPDYEEESKITDSDQPINTDINDQSDVVTTNELPNLDDQPMDNDMANNSAGTGRSEEDFDAGFDNPVVAENPTTNEPDFDAGFDDPVTDNSQSRNDISGIPNSLNNQITQKGGLQDLYFGMDQKTIETLAMGLGGLLLIIVILMMARRRRLNAQGTRVQEFDFTGSTQIDEQTKTHIDI